MATEGVGRKRERETDREVVVASLAYVFVGFLFM